MNNSESAKKGFRTFILTLAVSLMVFSAVYYVLTTYTQKQEGYGVSLSGSQQETALAQEQPATQNSEQGSEGENVQGAKDERGSAVEKVSQEEKTIFGQIAQAGSRDVLAGATSAPQTPQTTSSVPTTGFTEMTLGLIVSLLLFVSAMIYTVKNPRKMALAKFEKGALMKTDRQK